MQSHADAVTGVDQGERDRKNLPPRSTRSPLPYVCDLMMWTFLKALVGVTRLLRMPTRSPQTGGRVHPLKGYTSHRSEVGPPAPSKANCLGRCGR